MTEQKITEADAKRLREAADRMSPLSKKPYTSLDLALVREAAYRASDAVKAQTEAGAEEWEYAQSEILDDGTTAFGHPVSTLDEAIRRRDLAQVNYPWPEELGVGRRRKAGPWEPVSPKKGQD